MATTEVNIPDANDLFQRLTDMRVWLDDHRCEPSTFKYFYLDPGMMIRVSFKIDNEAEAFAQKFGGSLLVLGDRPAGKRIGSARTDAAREIKAAAPVTPAARRCKRVPGRLPVRGLL